MPGPIEHLRQQRLALLNRTKARVGAEHATVAGVACGDDRLPRMHGVDGVGPADAVAAWRADEGVPLVMMSVSIDCIAPLDELSEPPQEFADLEPGRQMLERFGLRTILHMNVTGGETLCSHVLFAARGPVSRRRLPEEVRLSVERELCAGLREAAAEEDALAAPHGTVFLAPDGSLLSDEPLGAWITRVDAEEWLRAIAASAEAPPLPPAKLPHERFVAPPPGPPPPRTWWAPRASVTRQRVPGGGTLLVFQRVRPLTLPLVLTRLTQLQRRVASLAATGATNAEIGRHLDRSPDTVREHLERIYQKLGIGSRAELSALCARVFV